MIIFVKELAKMRVKIPNNGLLKQKIQTNYFLIMERLKQGLIQIKITTSHKKTFDLLLSKFSSLRLL